LEVAGYARISAGEPMCAAGHKGTHAPQYGLFSFDDLIRTRHDHLRRLETKRLGQMK
jgi:hypothetical protein